MYRVLILMALLGPPAHAIDITLLIPIDITPPSPAEVLVPIHQGVVDRACYQECLGLRMAPNQCELACLKPEAE